MTHAQVAIPPRLIPVFDGPADVRGAHGGRGSGKTRSFAKMAAVYGYRYGMQGVSGIILCARQFMNSLAESSLEEVKRAIEDEPWLASYYTLGEKFIRSRDGRIDFAFSGLDRSIDAVKSKGRILLCWVDEAEPVTATAWDVLAPTLREEGDGWHAELWVTWNPKRKNAAVEQRFRGSADPRVKIVELNYQDNPRFPALLDRIRRRDLIERPESYPHIWEGQYISVQTGAYYAAALLKARQEGRIGFVAADPLMTYRAYWDIGGTGAKADACAIWIAQFVGREVRLLDYYESRGQPLAAHVEWLRGNGYGGALCVLPHDGRQSDKVFSVSYESSLREAGFEVRVVPNMGAGAANARIEAARRLFPAVWINDGRCQGGIDALGWYHEKLDEKRNLGLGPDHDWSSHGADAFGLMCVDYDAPAAARNDDDYYIAGGSGGWMA